MFPVRRAITRFSWIPERPAKAIILSQISLFEWRIGWPESVWETEISHDGQRNEAIALDPFERADKLADGRSLFPFSATPSEAICEPNNNQKSFNLS
jgi:hypothetical protein